MYRQLGLYLQKRSACTTCTTTVHPTPALLLRPSVPGTQEREHLERTGHRYRQHVLEGLDVAAALRGRAGDRRRVWDFIHAFAGQWCTLLTSGDGLSGDQIAAAECRLGVGLPRALHEAYGFTGRPSDLIAYQNPLLDPSRLHFEDDGEVLVCRIENQGCWAWGIAVSDLGQDDPPVLLFCEQQAVPGWEALLESVSLACVETVLSEQVMLRRFDGRGLARARPPSTDLLTCIEAAYARVELPDYPWSYRPRELLARWCAGPGQLILVTQGTTDPGVVLIAQTPDHLEAFFAQLPGPWPTPPGTRTAPLALPPSLEDPWATPGGLSSDGRATQSTQPVPT